MVKSIQYKVEEVRDAVVKACTDLYGEPERGIYFTAPNTKVLDVEMKIINELENDELAKKRYLDMCACILQSGDDVVIKIV